MTDNLKVTYQDLETAATAMTTAAQGISDALQALVSGATLDAGDFGSKGEKFADWYLKNMTNAQASFRQSHHSFGEIAKGLQRSAGVYALVDAIEAKNATNNGGK